MIIPLQPRPTDPPRTFARPRPARQTFDNVIRFAPRRRAKAYQTPTAAQQANLAAYAAACVVAVAGLWLLGAALHAHLVARAAADLAQAAAMRGM